MAVQMKPPVMGGIAPQMLKPQMPGQPPQMQPQKAPVVAQAPAPPSMPANPSMGAPSGRMPMNTPSGVLPPMGATNGNTGIVPPAMGGSPVPQAGGTPSGPMGFNPAQRDIALRNLAMQQQSAPTMQGPQGMGQQLQPLIDAIHNAPDQAARQQAIQAFVAEHRQPGMEPDNSEFSNEFDRLEERDRARIAKRPQLPQVDPRDAEVANMRRMRHRRTSPPPQGY